jgi:transcription-repair coupling factor (superfamily II helicase)
VAQEALRLDLYRRISTAGDHASLQHVRDETVDRYGALPPEVETLFAVASLRVTAAVLGVEEITTFREQIRIRPVGLDDALISDLEMRVYGATYHPEKQTLNLVLERLFGVDLVRSVERDMLGAAGVEEPVPS